MHHNKQFVVSEEEAASVKRWVDAMSPDAQPCVIAKVTGGFLVRRGSMLYSRTKGDMIEPPRP